MEKLKIGTVFSGIGALEHAFKRMEIPYEIKFACDTDDVDIFSRKIEGTYQDKIHEEIGELKNIAEKSNYRNRKKINNLSESDKNIKESQNMPIIYYRKINFPTSEEAYFWYGRDWTENNPQKVQKYYGKDIDIFHVPNPIDKLNQLPHSKLWGLNEVFDLVLFWGCFCEANQINLIILRFIKRWKKLSKIMN